MNALKILLEVHKVPLLGYILGQSSSELSYNHMLTGVGLYC
jgi:hypothetical protein